MRYEVGEELGQRMTGFIERICRDIGPRLGTSSAEKEAGERIRSEYSKYCTETFAEEFSCHPAAFLDCVRVSVALYLVGALLYLWLPIFTFILSLLALVVFVAEMMWLREVVDPLFPRRTGVNIYGRIKPQGEVKHRVLISGHHDSAYEFPLFRDLGVRAFNVVIFAIILVVATGLLGLGRTVVLLFLPLPLLRVALDWLIIIPLVGAVIMLVVAFRLRSGRVVQGANDNLSGVAVTLGVGEWLSKHPLRCTEVWLVSFACEENMRGSKRFAQHHQEELKDAYLLNFDCVGAGSLAIVEAEPMFRTTLTSHLCVKVAQAAKKAGLEIPIIRPSFGGTDASNFIKAGLQATSVIAITETGVPAHWHTLEDTPDKIDPQVLLESVRLAVAFLKEIDEEG